MRYKVVSIAEAPRHRFRDGFERGFRRVVAEVEQDTPDDYQNEAGELCS